MSPQMRECSPLDSLSDILMDVPDLVFVYSTDGRYLFVNTAAAEFLESDSLEVIGRDWRELGYPAEVMEPLLARVSEVARTHSPVHYRTTTSAARGSRTLDMSLTPLPCSHDAVMAVLAIAHDVSEFFPTK